jgi:hypothetical protein
MKFQHMTKEQQAARIAASNKALKTIGLVFLAIFALLAVVGLVTAPPAVHYSSDEARREATHKEYQQNMYDLDRAIHGEVPAAEKALQREYEYQRSR